MSKNSTGSLIRTRNQMILSDQDKTQIRATVQQLYYENEGNFPTAEIVYEKLHRIFPLEKIEEVLTDEEQVEQFEKAGVKIPRPVGGVLTPLQLMVANKMFNFQDKDSMRMFLDALGVTTSQYNAWLRDPVFVEHVTKRATDLYKDANHIAYRQLVKAMESGDINSVKLFFEMTGKYSKNINMNMNIEVVIARVVEVIARHVKEADVIEAIARDLEALDA